MTELLFYIIFNSHIILGIALGFSAALYVIAILLEHSNDNGNKAGTPEDFDAQIKIVISDDSPIPFDLMNSFKSSQSTLYKDR